MQKVEDFIVEIGTEELPPKDLQLLATSFASSLSAQLNTAGIEFSQVHTFAAPRRLAVLIKDLNAQQPEQNISKRGPALAAAYNADGTPTKAALGFASSCGVSMQELTTQETDKGAWLFYAQTVAGQKTTTLLPAMVQTALAQLPIKKNMRWGTGEFAFVRPVHWILMMFGNEIVPAKIFGAESSNFTMGHRIHCPHPITISKPSTYANQLSNEGKVIADFKQRQQQILDQVTTLAQQQQGTAVIAPELLDLVTGLVEQPVALLANFNPEFLRVPKECLISAMQDHQKCFAMIDKQGNLLPKFILISNLHSTSPETVVYGNELVMNARLADAAFYFDKDQQQTLASRVDNLKTVIYQKKLGSIYDKTKRIQKLAVYLAEHINADINITSRAAELCKADLLTQMVYEFPELQGIMGCYYAKHDQEPDAVATAIQEHYQPRFAQDTLPQSAAGICIALADRIDTLVGMFGIDNIPTGEKDPYALRRQALAVLRIIIEAQINLNLEHLINKATVNFEQYKISDKQQELLTFFNDRLKAWYLAAGISAKTFAAVAETKAYIQPLDFDRRIKAVTEFEKLPEAASLAAANKRVQNLLEKSAQSSSDSFAINESLLTIPAEIELFQELKIKSAEINQLSKTNDYSAILKSLATLQTPVDNFFNNVMVMDEDLKIRQNRLNLLQNLRNLFLKVADVSLL